VRIASRTCSSIFWGFGDHFFLAKRGLCYNFIFQWENEHYRIIPDEYPSCTGYLLLISKPHQLSHMNIPLAQLPSLEHAQNQARRFLIDTFGKVSFLENGGIRQQVSHAYLHCSPFTSSIPETWVEQGVVHKVGSWKEVWLECEEIGHYCYLETMEERFILSHDKDYLTVLDKMHSQITSQTNARIYPTTGQLQRGDTAMVTETIKLWQDWYQKLC
jgi:diadenosine tetraphosphate (Ap4A) HIT family hydrolase